MADRAKAVQEAFEERQNTTEKALENLFEEIGKNERRKMEQAAKGLDGLTFFVFKTLETAGVSDAEAVSRRIRQAFVEFPNWKKSESELRELRKKVTFAVYAGIDDLGKVTAIVDALFNLLERGNRT